MNTSFLLQRYHGNRRKDIRLKTQLPACLCLMRSGSDVPLDEIRCVTSDISLHGARLVIHSNKPILNNSPVELRMKKTLFGWKFHFSGLIRWIQREPGVGHGILGVFFHDVNPPAEKPWTRFLLNEATRLKIPLNPDESNG